MNRLPIHPILALFVALLASPAFAGDSEPAPAPIATAASPIVSVKEQAVWTSPNGKAELLKIAQGDNAFVALLNMLAGAVVPVHRDATEEYILFLSGGGILTLDGVTHEVAEGHAVYMAPSAEVTFTAGPDGATVFQVFAGPEPAAKYDAWTAPAVAPLIVETPDPATP